MAGVRARKGVRSGPDILTGASAELHLFIARHIHDPSDAADIAQQALLQAWTNLPNTEVEDPCKWLFAIGRNLIVDHFRLRGRAQFVESSIDDLTETEPMLQSQVDTFAANDHRQQLRALMTDIIGLPSYEHQVALLLADVHQRRDKSSAVTLRMSVSSFKLLLAGARAALRRKRGIEASGAPANDVPSDKERPLRLGVRCYLSRMEILSLRRELLGKILR
jgi:DNA-directed RNA polymerase specialized sigma24 family protein